MGGVCVDTNNDTIYFCDFTHHAVRAISPEGYVYTLVRGITGASADEDAEAEETLPFPLMYGGQTAVIHGISNGESIKLPSSLLYLAKCAKMLCSTAPLPIYFISFINSSARIDPPARSHPLGIVFDKFAALRGQPRLLVLDRHRVIEVKLDAASMVWRAFDL